MGHEFTSLVLALLQTGGHPPKLDAEAQFSGVSVRTVIGRLLGSVAPPTDRVA